MAERITDQDLELLGELGVEATPLPSNARSAREQRIIAGFEEIERFVAEHSRLPQHGENRDIFERLYAVRLDRMRELDECREVLTPLDTRGLLDGSNADVSDHELSDEALLESLGVEAVGESDVTRLVHVRSRAEIKAAEEIAQRAACPDFDIFKPLFDKAKSDLKAGFLESRIYGRDTSIVLGDFFIVGGQMAYVAHVGETIKAPNGENDARLRVIYANGTESNLLRRSLQRALYKDEAGRRLVDVSAPHLFSGEWDQEETASGTIYVLRSQSEHPFIAEHRTLIHKIGVTSGNVQSRIANAKQDPTFLLSEVEIVATFQLANINRHKLEKLLHKFFGGARLDMQLVDRFETPVKPREWFFVPLAVIEQVIDKINDSTLDGFRYDAETASLIAL